MNEAADLSKAFIDSVYLGQGISSIDRRKSLLKTLLSERSLPKSGWDDMAIEYIIQEISMMDSNNFPNNIGAGEREGRVISSLVRRRHYNFSHGIGRSGDIAEVQPKAAGSSLLYKLTNHLALSALHLAKMKSINRCIVLPLATGMSISLCLTALKLTRPSAKYVIWPRIDQKSCFKSILTAGLIPLIVENIQVDDFLTTDINQIQILIEQYHDEILCVFSTTSCFAPRIPDSIDDIAKICKVQNIPHIINNAYGLQCQRISRKIQRSITIGRVDYIIQSTDKNFLVPVGGAIVSSPSNELISELAKIYPGRASVSPILDLFITLLSLGVNGLLELWANRERVLPLFINRLDRVARNYHQRILICPYNSISLAVTLDWSPQPPSVPSDIKAESLALSDGDKDSSHGSVTPSQEHVLGSFDELANVQQTQPEQPKQQPSKQVTFIGSMLFQRLVSGTRVVLGRGATSSTIGGFLFTGWGSHSLDYPVTYLTAACAVGMTEIEVDGLITKLDRVLYEFCKNNVFAASEIPSSVGAQQQLSMARRSVVETSDEECSNDLKDSNEMLSTQEQLLLQGLPGDKISVIENPLSDVWMQILTSRK